MQKADYSNMKRVRMCIAEEEEFEVALTLSILRVEDIENQIFGGYYGVIWWVEPGEEYRSQVVPGKPNPIWNLKWNIQLRNLAEPKFVNLEVIRYGTDSEPGTSTGYAAVSRARVPLPKKINMKKEGKFGLVRIEGPGEVKPDGHIVMSMQTMHLFKI